MVHRLSREDARRIAVRAQLLDEPRPDDVLETIRHLTCVQVDLTAVVAPSADLVLWSRLGSSYSPAALEVLLVDRAVVELQGMLRPGEDVALHRADMAAWPGRGPLRDWQVEIRQWVEANEACRQEILQLLRAEGPLPARELPDTCALPWRSTGWTDGRNVLRLLGFLEQRGEVAVSSREHRERVWDLAERVHPDGGTVPADEAHRELDRRRLRALGIARGRPAQAPVEPEGVGEAGEPAVIEGVRGRWRVDPEQLGRPFRGRAALLSPLDRLVKDRKRMNEIFEFDYQLEMYKPAARRRWGYWAMPILYGDRLVGKLDAEADPAAGALFVHAVHEDAPFTRTVRAAVDREIRDLAAWLDLELAVQ
ncbi:MAG TPA: crosslink repair DNA glycosylase YcaQ family protein [Marmoricola sp.]